MGARSGKEFLEGLRTRGREVWLGPECVDDVTEHPAFAGPARSIAAVFDRQFEFPDDCLMPDPETGESINVSHIIPQCKADLLRRQSGLLRISEATVGLMGRTPDYMNVTFAGFVGEGRLWSGSEGPGISGPNEQGYANLVAFQRHIARNDISLTHTIVHPNVDKVNDNFVDNPVPLHKTADTEHGIIVNGAKILATLAPFADEIAVYPGAPFKPGSDPRYSLSFSIPMDTPGLVFLCRDSTTVAGGDPFDRPLSSRFDEQDAFVIFDHVEVPRDRVFIDANLDIHNVVMSNAWFPNVMQQTTTRAITKLEFAYGLASKLAETLNDQSPTTMDALGEIYCYIEVARSALELSIERSHERPGGGWFPEGRPLHPMRALLADWFPRINDIIVRIGSHNLLAAPSRGMLDDPRVGALAERYLHGADGVDANERAALFRLAWDFVGSGFGARAALYERYYLASAPTTRISLHTRYADRTRPYDLVRRMLDTVDQPAVGP